MTRKKKNKELFNTTQVAEMAGVDRDTVIYGICMGFIPRPSYKKNDIACYYNKQEAVVIAAFVKDNTSKKLAEA